MRPTGAFATASAVEQPPADRVTAGLRLLGIVLLMGAWFPAGVLLFGRPIKLGLLAGLPAAVAFAFAYGRSRAVGNLVGVGLALATPLVWLMMLIGALGGASLD